MPLQRQKIEFPFGGGVDTKTDRKAVIQGKMLLLENAIQKKGKRLQLRPGGTDLGKNISGSASNITSGSGFGIFNDELLIFSNQQLYAYNEANDNWVLRGNISSPVIKNETLLRNNYQQSEVQGVTSGGITVFAWADTRGGIKASVYSESDNSLIQSEVSISSSGLEPKVHAIGNTIWVFYHETTTLKGKSIQLGNPTAFSSAVTIKSDLKSTESFYDVINFRTKMIFVYRKAATFGVFYANEQGIVSPFGTPPEISISEAAVVDCLTIVNLDDNYVFVGWHQTTGGVKAQGFDSNLNALFSATVLDSDTAQYDGITGVKSASGTVKFFYAKHNASAWKELTKVNTITIAGAAGSTAVFKRSVGLASKAFVFNGFLYLFVAYQSTQQSVFFLLNESGEVLVESLYGIGGGLLTTQNLPEISVNSNNEIIFPCMVKTEIVTENNLVFTTSGVQKTKVNFADNASFSSEQFGDNLFILGASPQIYDGVRITESGFHIYPENVTASQTTGGSIADGTYAYAVLYSWIDARGQVHRSTPFLLNLTVTAGSGTAKVNVVVDTLRLTKKPDVAIEVYRTQASGTVYYKLTSTTAPTFNDPTTDTVTYADSAADASIVQGEILYTQGGILENTVPEPCSAIMIHENRMITTTDRNNVLQHSKERKPLDGIAFNDQSLIKPINPDGGPITGLASLDDKVILFKENGIRGFTGSGPNNAGQNNDYSQDEEIASDVGCTNLNSIVKYSGGLLFESNKGLYQLDRSLQSSYIGAEVEDFNDLTITSAVLVDGVNQIRFTTLEGACLVYDYYFGQWYTFTGDQAVDAVMHKGRYHFLKADGTVRKEDTSIFTDQSKLIPFALKTSWLKLDELQGFQRIYRIAVLGEYKSVHRLKIDLSYDYEDVVYQSKVWDPTTALNTTKWGSDPTWGEPGTKWGGPGDNTYQVSIKPKRQKCEAIKIGLSGVQSSPYGEAFSLTGLAFLAGFKGGINRLKATKKV